MDAIERRAMIERLRAEAAEGRAELERRRLARESDPVLEQQWLMASEPIRRPTVQNKATQRCPPLRRTRYRPTTTRPPILATTGNILNGLETLERENIALKAKLDVVLALLGKSDTVSNLEAADVIDVPKRRRTNAA